MEGLRQRASGDPDHFRRDSDDGGIVRDVVNDDGIRADLGIVTHADGA